MSKLSYKEMIQYADFDDRLRYLKLNGEIGKQTFGSHRYLNQKFYKSKEWQDVRNKVILRDNGCDLGVPGHEIYSHLIVHHLNPITVDNFEDALNLDNLVCVSLDTHNFIHYGYERNDIPKETERKPNDTCPWK